MNFINLISGDILIRRRLFGKTTKYKNINFMSKAEREVAKTLDDLGIKYLYQPTIPDLGFKPDFYLPEFDVYVEYMGVRGSKEYYNHNKMKKNSYSNNGYRVAYIYPNNLKELKFILLYRILMSLKGSV